MIKFKPAIGTAVVQIVPKGKTESGIFLPEQATDADEAFIVAAHPESKHLAEFKMGDKVLIKSNSTCQKLKLGDKQYLVFEETAILGAYQ